MYYSALFLVLFYFLRVFKTVRSKLKSPCLRRTAHAEEFWLACSSPVTSSESCSFLKHPRSARKWRHKMRYVGGSETGAKTSSKVLTFCWPCISVHLSHYLTKLMHKICFKISFISCLYMFRAHVLIIRRSKLYYTASGIVTPVHETATYRYDNTRRCIIQFWFPDDEHMVLEPCRGMKYNLL